MHVYIADIIEDTVPDTQSILVLVNSRREMIHRHYPTWSTCVISIAPGLLRMVGVRYISLHDLVRFLYPAQGDDFLRAHDRQTYIYKNRAFSRFTGLFPESLLSICQGFARCFEGSTWGYK